MPLIAGKRADSIGGHAIERPVAVGVRESTWLAYDRTGDPCVIEVWERFDDGPVAGADLDAFVERAALQRRVAAAGGNAERILGGGHVVGVRTLEATDFGAFYTRDRYGVSAAELAAGKVRLRGDALHEIMSGVVGGLQIFRERAGRPHGGLDASAVLISDGAPGKRRVGLRAPATAGELAEIGDPDGDELRRIGLLIFELVQHRPFRAMGGYPVRDGSEWQGLGKSGGFWLGLVNELLAPSGCRLTLGEVASRIAGLRFRVDKPGAGVWLGRAGIAAAVLGLVGGGVWFGLRPSEEAPRADYRDSEFEQWLRTVPVVVSLRERVGAMPDAPAVLREAVGRLDPESTPRGGVDDYFDIPSLFEEAELYRVFRARLDGPLPQLVESVQQFAQKDFEARAETQEESEDQKRLERLAFLFRKGLARFGVETESEQVADAGGVQDETGETAGGGSSDPVDEATLSLLDSFSHDNWASHGMIAGLVEGDGVAWFRPSAASLFSSQLDEIRDGLSVLADGATDFDGATAHRPVVGAVEETVGRFVGAVESVERTAGVIGVWRDGLYPRIESGSSVIAAASAWPDVPASVADDLPDGGDPYLASFESFAERVGVVGDGETDEDLGRRLEAAAAAVDAVRAVIERGWDAGSVDLLAHAAWVESARDRIAERPAASDGDELAVWIDARIALSEEWLESVASATPVAADSDWPAADFASELAATRDLWREAMRDARQDTLEAEAEIAGGVGVIAPALDAVEERLREVRRQPRWRSLRDEVDSESRGLERDFASLATMIERIHAQVLQPPRDLIAFWRENPIRVEGFDGAEELALAGGAIVERYAVEWERWAAGEGLDDEALKRAPQTDRLRTALRGVDEVVRAAAEDVLGVLGEARAYGRFDGDAVEGAVGRWLAGRFAEAVLSFEGWSDKSRLGDDGVFATRLGSLADEAGSTLDALAADLGTLSESSGLVARGYGVGDRVDGFAVGDRVELASLADRLRSPDVPSVADIDEIDQAVLAVEGLVEISRVDDPSLLMDAFVAECGSAGRAGIGVQAIRRLDSIGRDAGAWPSSIDVMLRDRDGLADGISALRGTVPAGDFEKIGEALRGIVRAWWLRGVAEADDRGDFARGVSGASSWFDGVGDGWVGVLGSELLTGRARYNAALVGLRAEIDELGRKAMVQASSSDSSAIPGIDARLLSDVRAKLGEINRLAQQTLDDGERARALMWVRGFERELNDAQGGRRGWDEAGVGPVGAGLANWSATLDENVEPPRVVYSYSPPQASDAVSIEFRLVSDLPSGGQVFLGADEVSVAVFGAMLRGTAEKLEDRLAGSMYEDVDGRLEGNMVEGPSTRELFARRGGRSRFRVRSRELWLDSEDGRYGPPERKASFPSYPDGLRGADPKSIAPSQGEPDEAHPVNYVNSAVAFDLAEAFGCRLPTIEEFQAAMSAPGVPSVRSGRWNLRDATFGRQVEHFKSAFEMEVTTHYQPGKWSYDGTNGASSADWGLAGDDDRLWFYRTGAGVENGFQNGVLFRHLIGNVAEYVIVDEGARDSRGVRILGASALSDPTVSPGDVREVDGARNGYVDVGFRLAIDADDFGSLGKLVRRQIAESDDSFFVAGGG